MGEERIFELEERLTALYDELYSLFELVLEQRTRLEALERDAPQRARVGRSVTRSRAHSSARSRARSRAQPTKK